MRGRIRTVSVAATLSGIATVVGFLSCRQVVGISDNPQTDLTTSKYFDEIGAAPDAKELYSRMLKRTAVLASGSGGLGLARIWAESEMTIRLEVTGNEVVIYAEGPVAPLA